MLLAFRDFWKSHSLFLVGVVIILLGLYDYEFHLYGYLPDAKFFHLPGVIATQGPLMVLFIINELDYLLGPLHEPKPVFRVLLLTAWLLVGSALIFSSLAGVLMIIASGFVLAGVVCLFLGYHVVIKGRR